ncbi:MAG: DNA starvation/stationary phase protection protein [Chitinophagaceae bacterium]|nr:MAG: DNA starvation/stationary phase protection protein [Chitinophagaceae bacterium]
MSKIGLEKKKAEKVADKMNVLLANYHIYYQNLRNFHWNITGENFFELHEKFEDYYTETLTHIDEIAERILTLGFRPTSNVSDYLKISKIKEAGKIIVDKEMVKIVVDNMNTLLEIEREVIEEADKAGDEGTQDLIAPYISGKEKDIWMLNAFLK